MPFEGGVRVRRPGRVSLDVVASPARGQIGEVEGLRSNSMLVTVQPGV